jgi:hypothetical protein
VLGEPRVRLQKGACKGPVIDAKMISFVKNWFKTFAEFGAQRKTTR